MEIKWEDGFEIKVTPQDDGAVVLEANRQGLKSLANILLTLSEEPPGSHIHLDEFNSLETGSTSLLLCLTTPTD